MDDDDEFVTRSFTKQRLKSQFDSKQELLAGDNDNHYHNGTTNSFSNSLSQISNQLIKSSNIWVENGYMENPIRDYFIKKTDYNTVGIWNSKEGQKKLIYKYSSLSSWGIWWEYYFGFWIQEYKQKINSSSFFVSVYKPQIVSLEWDDKSKRVKHYIQNTKSQNIFEKIFKKNVKPTIVLFQEFIQGSPLHDLYSKNKHYFENPKSSTLINQQNTASKPKLILHSNQSKPIVHSMIANSNQNVSIYQQYDFGLSLYIEIMFILGLAQHSIEFTHYDLHPKNILCKPNKISWNWYRICDPYSGEELQIILPNFGKKPIFIDYEFSYHYGVAKSCFNLPISIFTFGALPGKFSSCYDVMRFHDTYWNDLIRILKSRDQVYAKYLKLFEQGHNFIYKKWNQEFNETSSKQHEHFYYKSEYGLLFTKDLIFKHIEDTLNLMGTFSIKPIFYNVLQLILHNTTVNDFYAKPEFHLSIDDALVNLTNFWIELMKRPNLTNDNIFILVQDLFTIIQQSFSKENPNIKETRILILEECKFHCAADEDNLIFWIENIEFMIEDTLKAIQILYSNVIREVEKGYQQYFKHVHPFSILNFIKNKIQYDFHFNYESLNLETPIEFYSYDLETPIITNMKKLGFKSSQWNDFLNLYKNLDPFQFADQCQNFITKLQSD